LQSQTRAKLVLDCRLSSLALDAQKQVHLLQIVREAVLNAIKHADASEIVVSCVTTADGTHTVTIRDNGIGIGVNDVVDAAVRVKPTLPALAGHLQLLDLLAQRFAPAVAEQGIPGKGGAGGGDR